MGKCTRTRPLSIVASGLGGPGNRDLNTAKGIQMPTITNLGDYGKLPVSLKAGLFTVLKQATQLVRCKYPGAMSDSLHTKLFASKLNGRLKNPIFATDLSTLTLFCPATLCCLVMLTRKTIITQDMITVRCIPLRPMFPAVFAVWLLS